MSTRTRVYSSYSSSFYSSSFDGKQTVEQTLKVEKDASRKTPKVSYERRVDDKTVAKSSDPKKIREMIEGKMALKAKPRSKGKDASQRGDRARPKRAAPR